MGDEIKNTPAATPPVASLKETPAKPEKAKKKPAKVPAPAKPAKAKKGAYAVINFPVQPGQFMSCTAKQFGAEHCQCRKCSQKRLT